MAKKWLAGCLALACLLGGAVALAEASAEQEIALYVTQELQSKLAAWKAPQEDGWLKEMLAGLEMTATEVGEPAKNAYPVKITVTYPAPNSGLTDQSKYDGSDPQAFLRQAVKTAAEGTGTFTVLATVKAPEGEKMTLKWDSAKGVEGLQKALTKQAKDARKSFAAKPVVQALTDWGLIYPVRNVKLNLNDGLSAVKLSAATPDLSASLSETAARVLATLTVGTDLSQRDPDAVSLQFAQDLESTAKRFARITSKPKSDDPGVAFTFDLRRLAEEGLAACPELEKQQTVYQQQMVKELEQLLQRVAKLPDYPAEARPKTGRLAGDNFGTRLFITRPNGNPDCLILFTHKGTDWGEIACYIREKDTLRVRLNPGEYKMEIVTGDTWYGLEHLFGPEGTYLTADVTIEDGKHHHLLNLSDSSPINVRTFLTTPLNDPEPIP